MSITTALVLSSLPAGCMLLFTIVGLGVKVPDALAGALQHFAAGILLCTIATELLPVMDSAKGIPENIAAFIGFFAGVATLLFVGAVLPCHEHDDDDCHDHVENPRSSLFVSKRRKSSYVATASKANLRTSTALRNSDIPAIDSERYSLIVTKNISIGVGLFPAALVLAIAVDGAIDGLLIGIAISAGTSAAVMMAISLTVEMSFLGLTLATALKGQPRNKSLIGAVTGPGFIMIGSMIGGLLSEGIENPLLLICLLSFGVSAVLFMVAEELLLEAHEDGEHVWWIDLQLYVGFYASIFMGKFIPEDA